MVEAWCFGLFVGPSGVYLLDFFCSGIQFHLLLSPYLCFISFFISWFICSRRWRIDKLGVFHANLHLCVLIHIWTKGEVGALLNRLKPSSKIFYWPFQGGTSFLDLFCFVFLSCVCYAFVCVCFYMPCCHLLGKGWPLGSHLWCLTVSLSFSHWYPGSGVVLDCIDSWSLRPYLLWYVALGM